MTVANGIAVQAAGGATRLTTVGRRAEKRPMPKRMDQTERPNPTFQAITRLRPIKCSTVLR